MRSLLFVAHTFPPASGSGAQRALALSRYLPAQGWQPVVLTPDVAWAAPRDEALLRELPPGLEVRRTRSLEPRPGPMAGAASLQAAVAPHPRSRGLMTRAKSQIAHAIRFPDAHVGWAPFAFRTGLRAIRERRLELIYSTAAPFTNHLVALLLARATRLPWVLELRDGWYLWNRAIFPDYPFWRSPLERTLERVALRSASRVVLVTELMARAFRLQHTDLPADHFTVVPNGFDPGQYTFLEDAPQAVPDRFEVVHAGALYYGRSSGAFLEAATRLASEDACFSEQFHLRLLGTLDEGARAEVARILAGSRIADRVTYQGYVSHRQALEAMRAANLLLLFVNTTPGAEATVPAKLFEYLAVGRPILAVVPPGSEGGDIVRSTMSGWVAQAHDPESIYAELRDAFLAHLAGTPPQSDAAEVARFDRRRQAADLAAIFDQARHGSLAG